METSTAGVDEVEKLRSELAAERKKNETLAQKGSLYDSERRAEIAAMQSDVDAFVGLLAEEFPDRKNRMQPITNWAKSMNGADAEPEHQLPLATALYCASAKVKRTIEEASQKAADSEALGRACQENDALKDSVTKLQKRETELEAHIAELDKRNADLDKVLRDHNISSKKFDFSKVSSREAGAAEPQSAAAPSGSGMEVSAAQANPVAAAAASRDPGLLSFLLAGGQGGGRFLPAQSSHALLSAVGPSV
jgi:cell division protein FtsB